MSVKALDRYKACAAIGCTAVFEVKHGRHKYCSKRCNERMKSYRSRPPLEERECAAPDCAVMFMPFRRGNHIYCSERCQLRVTSRRRRENLEVRLKDREHARRYYEECKPYVQRRRKAYYEANREAKLEWQRQYRLRKLAEREAS